MAKATLKSLQQHFLDYMLTGNAKGIRAALSDCPGINIIDQLAVYGEGYRLRFLGVLRDSFTLTKRLLGDAAFHQLANGYIDTIRSDHFAIETINTGFAQFLAMQNQPLVAEVAHIEWSVDQVLHAGDGEVFTLAMLEQQAAKGFAAYRFHMHPSVRCLTLHSNAMLVWQAYWLDHPLPALQAEPKQYGLLWLRQRYPTIRSIGPIEKTMVELVMAGETFSEACEVLCEVLSPDEAATFAVGRLQQWIGEELLVL